MRCCTSATDHHHPLPPLRSCRSPRCNPAEPQPAILGVHGFVARDRRNRPAARGTPSVTVCHHASRRLPIDPRTVPLNRRIGSCTTPLCPPPEPHPAEPSPTILGVHGFVARDRRNRPAACPPSVTVCPQASRRLPIDPRTVPLNRCIRSCTQAPRPTPTPTTVMPTLERIPAEPPPTILGVHGFVARDRRNRPAARPSLRHGLPPSQPSPPNRPPHRALQQVHKVLHTNASAPPSAHVPPPPPRHRHAHPPSRTRPSHRPSSSGCMASLRPIAETVRPHALPP